MKLWTMIALLLLGTLVGCDRREDDAGPWPVWILQVTVQDNRHQPVTNCARVVWNYSGSAVTNVTTCAETDVSRPEFVKVWKPIRDDVTLIYHIECEGYQNSNDISAFFDLSLAFTRPGAPGDEVIINETVLLFPE